MTGRRMKSSVIFIADLGSSRLYSNIAYRMSGGVSTFGIAASIEGKRPERPERENTEVRVPP
jgi:hypothetical protein